MNILSKFKQLFRLPAIIARAEYRHEQAMLVMGKILSNQNKCNLEIKSLEDVEFKIFSQWGDDGIIQWLIRNLDFPNHTFIEFGVEDYRESNTRFLMMNNNWSGFVMDGSLANIERIKYSEYFWKYDLMAEAEFITAENINHLLAKSGLNPNVGILHIDLDGNDYWIWKEINIITPIVVIVEYNSVFGSERAITVPYDPAFNRTRAHYNNLYAGASLAAMQQLAATKGYTFIGCNSAGNNSYYVRNDKLNDNVKAVDPHLGFVYSKFRESRDENGRLDFISKDTRSLCIRGLPVYNTLTSQIEPF